MDLNLTQNSDLCKEM